MLSGGHSDNIMTIDNVDKAERDKQLDMRPTEVKGSIAASREISSISIYIPMYRSMWIFILHCFFKAF